MTGPNRARNDDPSEAMSDGDEWQDPDPSWSLVPDVDRHLLALRLSCSVIVFLVLVFVTRGFLAEATGFLWPPTDPLGQWSMLVLLHLFGYVLVPVMVGSLLADRLAPRVLEGQ